MVAKIKNTGNETEIVLPKLAKRQSECLVIISSFFDKQRYYPTHKEIGQEMGCHPSAAGLIVVALEKKGYLKRASGEHRNIRLTKAGRMKLEMIKKEEETKQE